MLVLGSAQFGLQYGINNQTGIPDDHELKKIIDAAKSNSIKILDTAQAYGNAESRLSMFSDYGFKIITKFPNIGSEKELESSLQNSLIRLNQNRIYGFLAHNANTLIEKPNLWEVLLEKRKNQIISKIGYSLYFPEQLEVLLNMQLIPDIVQIPYSLLDRKFNDFLPILKNLGVEIHTRSVYLQGLYFMDPLKLPKKLFPISRCLNELKKISNTLKIDIGTLALKYVVLNPLIDFVVVGVDSENQLMSNFTMLDNELDFEEIKYLVEKIDIPNAELLNPTNW